MRLRRSNLQWPVADGRVRRTASRSAGVALVITVVMLSVITFLTVAFLALMGREKGSVKTSINQTTARFAAEAALERAKAELISGMLATSNLASFDLLISTNFINWNGFDPAAQNTLDSETNVNFEYAFGGAALTLQQARQNLTNLLYSPRVPVFITNRLAANSLDFRYYLDLNRNFRPDRSGLWPVTNEFGVAILNTNGLILSNYFIGDPEWIGGLDRPDKTHAPDNKFLYRYAYVVVPEGKTLDVNFMHNQAATRTLGPSDGFFRNQGVGPWELNLAGFLADLNTNLWNPNPLTPTYSFNQVDPLTGIGPTGFGNVGVAFDDARSILAHRYANNYNTLAPGFPAFLNNRVDEYADGSWLTTATNLPPDNDVTIAWAGSDNTNHFFTPQDLFNPAKTSPQFVNRLTTAGNSVSTYDQNTFYRLLAQLGTDSAPEDPDKLNLNYVNVDGYPLTNFLAWNDPAFDFMGRFDVPASVLFFTNVVDRLLKAYTTEWLATDYNVYTNLFKTDQVISITNIPVLISNQFVYSPSLHRVLQVAANIWDAQANKLYTSGEPLPLPTVFRPRFRADNGNIYISDFVEEATRTSVSVNTANRPILDLYALPNPAATVQAASGDVLIFGVPLIIGARKGLPNFNEFAMESQFLLTRKLELRKNASGGAERIYQTNQFFTISLTMPTAAEFWNSYASNYNRKVFIYVTNRTTMTLTNDSGVYYTNTFVTGGFVSDPKLGLASWPSAKTRTFQSYDNPEAFVVTMKTNVPFLPLVGYLPGAAGNLGFVSATNQLLFDKDQTIPAPRWGMTITNRVHAMIVDQATDQIVDYVLLGNLTSYRNLTEEFSQAQAADPLNSLWATNTVNAAGKLSGRYGAMAQIRISRGEYNYPSTAWRSFGNFNGNVASEIAKFLAFFETSGVANFDGKLGTNSTLQATVPFSPSAHIAVPMVWEANDPLVHYISSELFNLAESGQVRKIVPPGQPNTNQLASIGKQNKRYQPWGKSEVATDPDAYNLSLKDPAVTSSDAWQFPTNTFPTVGWLGRVHRGTPWQTIYLKASNIGLTNIVRTPTEWTVGYRKSARKWAEWTGNKTYQEGFYTRPVSDRVLFDVFSTALTPNSARGRLSINQTNLAAWSAVFSGVTYLTNVSTETELSFGRAPLFNARVIEPAGIYDPLNAANWPPLVRMVEGINRMRANTNFFANGTFAHLGDILAVPELTENSPFLNVTGTFTPTRGLTDAAYEWLPQQTLSLLQLGEPRFVVYAYGQALQPAPDSIITAGGNFFGLCTNYAITAEVALRAVVRVEGSPNPSRTNAFLPLKQRYPPRVVVESFNYLPPE